MCHGSLNQIRVPIAVKPDRRMRVVVKDSDAIATTIITVGVRIGARDRMQGLVSVPYEVQKKLKRSQPFRRSRLAGFELLPKLVDLVDHAVLRWPFARWSVESWMVAGLVGIGVIEVGVGEVPFFSRVTRFGAAFAKPVGPGRFARDAFVGNQPGPVHRKKCVDRFQRCRAFRLQDIGGDDSDDLVTFVAPAESRPGAHQQTGTSQPEHLPIASFHRTLPAERNFRLRNRYQPTRLRGSLFRRLWSQAFTNLNVRQITLARNCQNRPLRGRARNGPA